MITSFSFAFFFKIQLLTLFIDYQTHFISHRRLLHQPTTIPVAGVAFYAYFSNDIPAATLNHILAFDKVITNVGHAYHSHSGTSIASRSGLYVFIWTIRLYGLSFHNL